MTAQFSSVRFISVRFGSVRDRCRSNEMLSLPSTRRCQALCTTRLVASGTHGARHNGQLNAESRRAAATRGAIGRALRAVGERRAARPTALHCTELNDQIRTELN